MDFFNLPPLPVSDDDPIFSSRASLEFTDRILEIPGTGVEVAVGGKDKTYDPFATVTPKQFRDLVERLADYMQVELPQAFPELNKPKDDGIQTLGDNEVPEDYGKVRKRGSKRSVMAFLRKIPGWQGYFTLFYDPLEDEYVVVEND